MQNKEYPNLRECPFCGGKARISFKDCEFGGKNCLGDRKVKYRFQVICNKCYSRGKPVKTDFLINPNPWHSHYANRGDYYGKSEVIDNMTEMLKPWAEEAIEAWNRRTDNA